MEHQFNVSVAKDFNVNIAIFLHNIKYWTLKNLANKKHLYDGYCWVYNSLEAFQDLFPYWTKSQLETIINNSLFAGLIIKGNYNQTKYDRTCWYALTPKSYEYYPELNEEKYINLLISTISENSEIEKPKFGNGNLENRTPIPDSNPDSKPYPPPISPKGKSECDSSFEEFWEQYPVKKAKKKCAQMWKRKKLDSKKIEILSKLKEQIARDDQWVRGYIPHPSTYLAQERWEDDISISENERARQERLKQQSEIEKKQAEQIRLSELKRQEELRKQDEIKHSKKRFSAIKNAVSKPMSDSSRQSLNDLMRSLTGKRKIPDAP